MTEAHSRFGDVQDLTLALLDAIEEHISVSDFKPYGDRVLVKPMEREHIQKRGELFVVQDQENKSRLNLVLRVGSSVSADLSPGDVLITGRYVGHPQTIMGENLRLIKDEDLLAVLDAGAEEA